MSKPISYDDKKFIERKVEEGWTSKDIAVALKVSIGTVSKWRQRIKKKPLNIYHGSSSSRRFKYV